MTVETLDKIAELLAKAVTGDWQVFKAFGKSSRSVGPSVDVIVARVLPGLYDGVHHAKDNAVLIATLRNAAPELLDLAREALESRQLIEDAPHARDCANGCTYHKFWKASKSETWFLCDVCGEPDSTERHSRESGLIPCNCWKSKSKRPTREAGEREKI